MSHPQDCPQSVGAGIGKAAGGVLYMIVKLASSHAYKIAKNIKDDIQTLFGVMGEQADTAMELEQHLRQIDSLITEFQTLSIEIFNANTKIEDLKYQIKVKLKSLWYSVFFSCQKK